MEVGAADGISDSNTYCLESSGWSGLLVEPDPRQREGLRRNRRCEIAYCAAGRANGAAVFTLAEDRGLSGLITEGANTIQVQVKPLEQILEQHGIGAIDLLSIDTEGTELDVWRSLDLRQRRPGVVIIEWNTAGLPDRSAEIVSVLATADYRPVHRTDGNLIFVSASK